MTKNLFKMMAVAIFTIFTTSCDKDIPHEPSTLSVAKKAIVVGAENCEKTVAISTNTEYKTDIDVNWITVMVTNDKSILKFGVAQNKEGKERKGIISLTTTDGTQNATIEVTQLAVKSVEVEQDSIVVDADANENSVKVTAEVDYTAKTSAEWINITEASKTALKFSVAENTESAPREGVISLLYNDVEITRITVKQNGAMAYILPFTGWGQLPAEIKTFEQGRSNTTLTSDSSEGGSNDGTGGDSFTILKYSVASDNIFSELMYAVNIKGYEKASIFGKQAIISNEDKARFEAFLLKKGYEQITEKGYNTTLDLDQIDKIKFIHKATQTKAEFMADTKANHYTFTYHAVQQQPMQTISEFPPFSKWMSEADVLAYEENNGGIYEESLSNIGYVSKNITKDKRVYSVQNGNSSLYQRTHWIYKSGSNIGLAQSSFYYNDPSFAFYSGLDGKLYMTDEFLALATANNYVFQKKNSANAYYFYKNGDLTQGKMKVSPLQYDNGEYYFIIALY